MGINNFGQIVGTYTSDDPIGRHGFLYQDGRYTSFLFPVSGRPDATIINGINDWGVIAGTFADYSWGLVGTPSWSL